MYMIGTHQVCLRPVGAGTTLPSDYIIHIPHEQAMIFSSGIFLWLFAAFMVVYVLLQRKYTARILFVTLF